MNKQTPNDPLKDLIKRCGIDEPSDEFTRRLTHQVVANHCHRPLKAVTAPDAWIGRLIILILLGLNGLMLFKLNPFGEQPALCWAVGGFITFFCAAVLRLTKISAGLHVKR